MDPAARFVEERSKNIANQGGDAAFRKLSSEWLLASLRHHYSYNFTTLDRPIIQYPQDIIATQEIIWSVRPDLIIETGIAHGGSLILSSSMLALLDYCDAVQAGEMIDPKSCRRRVVGIDIDIRAHNRTAIDAHPMAHRIDMIEGSSIDNSVISRVRDLAKRYARVLVMLDSNHTHDHVLSELEAYAPLTSRGSYCIVFDTVVEDLPDSMFPDRPWGKGDNPKTAVWEYLRRLNTGDRIGLDGSPLAFEVNKSIEQKLLITVAPDGYLKRV